MKAVVLAAGSGTRMRPIAFSMAKQLIPVANKPILFYGLEDIAAAGVTETIIVIAPDTGAEIKAAVGDGKQFGLHISYVTQQQPLGIAHALGTARDLVSEDDVLLYLGDNMLKCGVTDIVASFQQNRPNCHILLSRVENPQRFGVVTLDAAGDVVELVEKPEVPASDLALAGVYLFDSTIWGAIDSLQPSQRGEYEITEAIQRLIDDGGSVVASEVEGWWKDTGHKEDLLAANELVLAALETVVLGSVTDTVVEGAVSVGEGSALRNTVVHGPVVVGANTTIVDSVLGPDTSIGDGCIISGASVVRSIILDGAQIDRWKLESSLLGRDVAMRGAGPNTLISVTLGERSEVIGP